MRYVRSESEIDLCGDWTLAYSRNPPETELTTAAAVTAAGLQFLPAPVPGNFEMALVDAGIVPDPYVGLNVLALQQYEDAHVWYCRRFRAEARPGHTAELLFEGIDCYADIYLNGQLLDSCDNMLVEHVFCVDGRLQPGENELVVHIRPAVAEARRYDYPPLPVTLGCNHEAAYVRKAPHMYGWDIMPRVVSAGLWRPVRLRYRPVERIEHLFVRTLRLSPDRREAQIELNWRLHTTGSFAEGYELRFDAHCGESRIAVRQRLGFDAGHLAVPVPNPSLWWPRGRGRPELYQAEAVLLRNGVELDRVRFHFGIRTAELLRSSTVDAVGKGEFCFRINGERAFILGTNWVPADMFHGRDAAQTPARLALAEEVGVNLMRCWGGNVYESDAFFDWCDEHGVMIWQDFAMACAVYPQGEAFQQRLAAEARLVVRRLRQHPSLVLWAGDNECDQAYGWCSRGDPNANLLTRRVLQQVVHEEDPGRPFLPSSPYIDSEAYRAGEKYLPENHLWGPRNYYKSDYYRQALCLFASEIGYHGCPAPASVRRFLSAEHVWPWQGNAEWVLHSTAPMAEEPLADGRIQLMATQIRELFGAVPDNLDDYAFASQACQAEAMKFFIEWFRAGKWRRTGIVWWNLVDGWPQFSDAIVDYYLEKKLAFAYVQRCQAPFVLVLQEPVTGAQALVACNDRRAAVTVRYRVWDADSGETLAEGEGTAAGDAVTPLASIPSGSEGQHFLVLDWEEAGGGGPVRSHYLAGARPFDWRRYRAWLESTGLLPG